MDDISTSTLFATNGALAEINLDEWMGGWVSIVGGVHGRPTAQQFNKVCNVLQQMILANQRSIQSADKRPTMPYLRSPSTKRLSSRKSRMER